MPYSDGFGKEVVIVGDDQNKERILPFSPPPMAAPSAKKPQSMTPKKKVSSKKQLRDAKREQKSPISVRSLISGLLILIATAIAVTAVISPSLLGKITSGEFVRNTETCKVTELNSSIFFDTTCGKFEWNKERYPGSPITKLKKGETYTFESVGLRVEPAQVFPYITNYHKAKG
jgi:hypothetical protein